VNARRAFALCCVCALCAPGWFAADSDGQRDSQLRVHWQQGQRERAMTGAGHRAQREKEGTERQTAAEARHEGSFARASRFRFAASSHSLAT